MIKNILFLSLTILASNALACVDLTGVYTDKVTTLKISQNKCESLTQSVNDWYIATEVKTVFSFDGKEHGDSNYKTSNGSYAFIKSQINDKEMIVTYRRGSPKVVEKKFIKKFFIDSNGSLNINTFDIQDQKEILKEKWVLRKK